jgi:hypothetical protein
MLKFINDYIKSIIIKEIKSVIKNKSFLNKKSQPNGNEHIVYDAYLSNNIKNIMGLFSEQRITEICKLPLDTTPSKHGLTSKLSTQCDLESQWCRYWVHELKTPIRYARKLWELGFVLQVLFEHDMFGKTGIGLACGSEMLPSYLIAKGCAITAGDKPFAEGDQAQKGWASSNQYTQSKDSLYHPQLVERCLFDDKFTLAYVDMNDLPHDLYEKFDFCWSICAVEHLGSIRHGLEFLENSLKLLRKGGISVHTTEFNLFSEKATIDNWGSVLFQKNHLLNLSESIAKTGGKLYPFDFDPGNGFFDRYIDMPPYPHQSVSGIDAPLPAVEFCPHIKLLCDGFPVTCAGIIMQK